MTSPTLRKYHAQNSQVYFDKRLREPLNFVSKHRGLSTREIATIGLAEVLTTYLEEAANEKKSAEHIRLCQQVSDEYQKAESFECPISDCKATRCNDEVET